MEDDTTQSTETPTPGGIRRKPLSRGSLVLSPPAEQEPTTSQAKLRFVLGPVGLHGWYDSEATESEEASKEQHSRYWSSDNDDRLRYIEENPAKDARTMQLFACSPNLVTAAVFTKADSQQQHEVKPPHQSLIKKFGKLKREYEKSVIAEQDLSAWITGCLLNNLSATDLQITFGPDEGYFAHAPLNRTIHRGLPFELQEMLEHSDGFPEQISMGIDGTWWIRWPDGKQEQYIQQNSYPDLCLLLEETEHPQLKSVQLNPAKANEFVVEYANGHFLICARCLALDLRRLNNYVREHATGIKVVVLASIPNALGKDILCEPFVLPTYDFETSPIVLGKEVKAGQRPEWMGYAKSGVDIAQNITNIASSAGACLLM